MAYKAASRLLSFSIQILLPCRYLNCHHAAICKTRRSNYVRTYPTVLVLPDGSTVNIRYKEPRGIIKLPVDISQLSPEERKKHLERRKPKTKVVLTEDSSDDTFNVNQYQHLWKK